MDTLTVHRADHITPYDRLALDEDDLVALLASRYRNEGSSITSAPELHAELAKLARATTRDARRAAPGAVSTCFPASWVRSSASCAGPPARRHPVAGPHRHRFRPAHRAAPGDRSRVVSLGAMNYSYLKLTLSLRKAASMPCCSTTTGAATSPRSANYSRTGSPPTAATTSR